MTGRIRDACGKELETRLGSQSLHPSRLLQIFSRCSDFAELDLRLSIQGGQKQECGTIRCRYLGFQGSVTTLLRSKQAEKWHRFGP